MMYEAVAAGGKAALIMYVRLAFLLLPDLVLSHLYLATLVAN